MRLWICSRNKSRSSSPNKSSDSESAQIQCARAVDYQFSHGFTNCGRMLEAVPRARRYDQHIRILRMKVDEESGIRKTCIKAGHRVQTLVGQPWKPLGDVSSVHHIDL